MVFDDNNDSFSSGSDGLSSSGMMIGRSNVDGLVNHDVGLSNDDNGLINGSDSADYSNGDGGSREGKKMGKRNLFFPKQMG